MPIFEIVPKLLSLDHPQGCWLCKAEDTAQGRRHLTSFADWWLSAEQRQAWDVRTLIQGRQRPDKKAMDAIFKFRHKRRADPVFVFYIIVQHLEDKNLPHYQLLISFSSTSMGLGGERSGVITQICTF